LIIKERTTAGAHVVIEFCHGYLLPG
jgi:hypothetical protein